ncbi:response regulator [Parachitinimonas caeni]|uniref:Response regulator transcription factor n=1 Tax=Parachitinimonas caeni TaxID=3031301 RepID=A0ABT7DSI6_9NEIS|nr:response regulator transcription factor [Parachitinimonas caeni]MDK2123031.1 response regulator transcription factor [Parachitinimonas caeni]
MTIRILLADDHAIVRDGLKKLLSDEADLEVVDEAMSAQEVLEKIDNPSLSFIMLDVSMPGANGLDLISAVRRRRPDLPMLVLSMHKDAHFAARVLRAGANSYLSKDIPFDTLGGAIRRTAQGGRVIDPDLIDALLSHDRPDQNRPLHEALSEREYQIFQRIASGHALNQIADELSLSPKTVSTYKNRLMEKLNVGSTAELVKYALEHDEIARSSLSTD